MELGKRKNLLFKSIFRLKIKILGKFHQLKRKFEHFFKVLRTNNIETTSKHIACSGTCKT